MEPGQRLRYVSEAYGGYHIDKMHGINVDAGIFMSYIGLASYYQFDNWTYQPSYVSSNTPWFFNGLRIQFFPTKKLKIERGSLTAGSRMASLIARLYWRTDSLSAERKYLDRTEQLLRLRYAGQPGRKRFSHG